MTKASAVGIYFLTRYTYIHTLRTHLISKCMLFFSNYKFLIKNSFSLMDCILTRVSSLPIFLRSIPGLYLSKSTLFLAITGKQTGI